MHSWLMLQVHSPYPMPRKMGWGECIPASAWGASSCSCPHSAQRDVHLLNEFSLSCEAQKYKDLVF